MQLEDGICHSCTLRDSKNKMVDRQPFLMSADNNMDPGDRDGSLPELSELGDVYCTRARPYAIEACPGPSVPLYESLCQLHAE
jgi:hypothetical protein